MYVYVCIPLCCSPADEFFPASHTCFFQLDLPAYTNKRVGVNRIVPWHGLLFMVNHPPQPLSWSFAIIPDVGREASLRVCVLPVDRH